MTNDPLLLAFTIATCIAAIVGIALLAYAWKHYR